MTLPANAPTSPSDSLSDSALATWPADAPMGCTPWRLRSVRLDFVVELRHNPLLDLMVTGEQGSS